MSGPREAPGGAGAPGLRVLDWGTGLPAAVAVRLFANCGASVVRVRGEADSHFHASYPALPWWYRDVETVDESEVDGLLPSIDVCLLGGEDVPELAVPGPIRASQRRSRHPHLVVVEIAGYVRGEALTTPATDLLVQARTGFVFEQFSDRPTQIAFAPTLYGAGILAVLGAWAAFYKRLRTGTGDRVRVSMQQAIALFWPHQWLTATRPDAAFSAVPPRDVQHLIFECADGGYVQIVLGVPFALAKLHAVLGIPGPADPADRGTPSLERGPRSYFADRDVLEPAIARWNRAGLVAALKEQGLPAEPVYAAGECFADAQALATGRVETGPDGVRYAAAPLDLADAALVRRPRDDTPVAGDAPLDGVRVIDLGNWVAGPYASKLLADLGADVISVEPPTGLSNLTGMRNVLAANRGKRSAVIDVKDEDQRAALRALIATADVVTHNFRVGVAERLGLDSDTLRADNPGLVYLHTTAYGRTGAKAGDSGFDMVMQALAGHEVRAGGAGNPPLWYRAPFVDYATGALGAIGVLAALCRRARAGRAVDVHVSLLSAAMFVRGEFAVAADGTVTGSPQLNAERTGMRPQQSLYRAADAWIAIDAPTEATWTAARRVLGVDVAAAVAARGAADIVAALARAGVWATECTPDALEYLLANEPARRAGLVIETPDERFGTVLGCYGPLAEFDSWTPGPAYRPAPLPGEHTKQVLAEACGRRHPEQLAAG